MISQFINGIIYTTTPVGAGPRACPNIIFQNKTKDNITLLKKRISTRLSEYDYSQSGYYFVTICVNDRQNLFGNIENGEMILNDAGYMVRTVWEEIPKYYDGIDIDAFQIMPNHIHGIIILNVGAGSSICVPHLRGDRPHNKEKNGQPHGVAPTTLLSLGDIVGRFKSLTTKKYTEGVKNYHWQSFNNHLWQRNYYEHIIRNEKELYKLRK